MKLSVGLEQGRGVEVDGQAADATRPDLMHADVPPPPHGAKELEAA